MYIERKGTRGTKEYMDVALEVKAPDVSDDGTFTGYGSVFGGKPDSYNDIVESGAFAKSLASGGRNGTGVAMLWQHMADRIPGKWIEVSEDKRGLKVVGQLAMGTQLGKEAYELLKMGAIGGLSIGYQAKTWEIEKDKQVRRLKEIDLWEISLVTFPANTRAKVINVKDALNMDVRELEKILCDAGIFSRSAARMFASKFAAMRREEEAQDISILEALRSANATLTNGGK